MCSTRQPMQCLECEQEFVAEDGFNWEDPECPYCNSTDLELA